MALLIALVIAARFAAKDRTSPEAAIAALRELRDFGWAIPAYLGAYLLLTTAFVPAVAFHLAAGATWGFAKATLINLIALNVASTAHFLLARSLGRERVARLFRRYGLLALDEGAKAHGVRAMIAIRAFPLPTMLVNVSAGVSGMRWRDFAIGTLIGATPYIVIYTYFAASIAEGVAGAERRAITHGVIAGGLILLIALGPRVWARWRVRREARQSRSSEETPTRKS